MKVFAVPTVTAGLTAALSVLFFTGISRVFGDAMLASIILLQAGTALVQMSCIPQGWVFVIGSANREALVQRYSQAVTVEIGGTTLGAALLLLAHALPAGLAFVTGGASYLIYASLAIQGSSSCIGWLRATENWRGYCLWNLVANLIRVPLIWATPFIRQYGFLTDSRDLTSIILIYFLLPDAVRYVLIYVPLLARHYRWPGWPGVLSGGRVILKNWFYDVGSALTDVGDKIIVGTLLGPQILVAYFFARKLGVISVMVVEPFHAEHYRRCAVIADWVTSRRAQIMVYVRGLALTIALFAAMMIAVRVSTWLPMLRWLIPPAVATHLDVFFMILLADCALSANRWSRYVAQMRGGAAQLFGVRITLFALFVGGVAWFGKVNGGMGVGFALGLVWSVEAAYLSSWLYFPGKDRIVRFERQT